MCPGGTWEQILVFVLLVFPKEYEQFHPEKERRREGEKRGGRRED
jgi:hypothetical protein